MKKLSSLYSRFDTKDRRRALKNIEIVKANGFNLPDDMYHKCFQKSGENISIIMRISKDLPGLNIDFKCKERFDRLYEKGDGIIVVTGHIGPFELIPAYLADKGYKISVIGKRLFDRRLDRYLVKERERFGTVNVKSDDSPIKLIRLLKKGYALGILPDVNTKTVANQKAEFFGIEARTPTGPVTLARATGLPILPMAIYSKGYKEIELLCLEEFTVEKSKDKQKDISDGLLKMNSALEKLILKDPEQWVWYHNRFKS